MQARRGGERGRRELGVSEGGVGGEGGMVDEVDHVSALRSQSL